MEARTGYILYFKLLQEINRRSAQRGQPRRACLTEKAPRVASADRNKEEYHGRSRKRYHAKRNGVFRQDLEYSRTGLFPQGGDGLDLRVRDQQRSRPICPRTYSSHAG